MKVLDTLPDNITNVLTDSRSVTPGVISGADTAFVALSTAVGDGHRFVRPLYERGLRTFVVDDATRFADLEDATFVVAPAGTLDFLIETAGNRLKASGARQIVVTGSRRKTTVKELIAKALRESGEKVARSPRTWNSAMGMALSVFDNVARHPDRIVTEVGIDAPGQAERVAPLLQPEIGVITKITDEHDEAFADHAAKVAEKVALVRNARRIVYDAGDPELCRQIEALDHPDAVGVEGVAAIVEAVTGLKCPEMRVSTRVEVRSVPDDGVLFIDSYTNDLDSLPLSLDMAERRRLDRKLAVFLGNFEGDRERAEALVGERGGRVFFYNGDGSETVNGLHRGDFAGHIILIKGKGEKLATFFDEARHDTTLQVDLDALVHNYNVYRSLLPQGTGIVGMVKADAYGLGALEVAKTLQSHGSAYLAVAVVDEGVALRKAGITMPIIVLNPITNRFEALVRYNLEPTVFSLDELTRIEDGVRQYTQKPVPVHVKLDTGMHRVGFLENELDALARRLNESDVVRPASIFSHLATADCPDLTEYTNGQVALYERMSTRLNAMLVKPVRRHLLNTAGIATLGRTAAAYDMARLGIGLYGVSPVSDGADGALQPVSRLVSTIISVKHWPAGTPIGYGCRGCTTRPSVIATVPIGYADGIDRHLGCGAASFLVNGVACPTIGNVCMDQLMLDITEAPGAGVGTEVEIFGPDAPISRLSDTLGTIPYEVLTSVSPRVRRTYHHR